MFRLAPEVINYAHSSKASDVFSFGIISWEVQTRDEVYSDLSCAQIIAKVANDGLRPVVPSNCIWGHIMRQCWSQDPTQRPSFSEIFNLLVTLNQNLSIGNKVDDRV